MPEQIILRYHVKELPDYLIEGYSEFIEELRKYGG
jgi:hypothetical protein